VRLLWRDLDEGLWNVVIFVKVLEISAFRRYIAGETKSRFSTHDLAKKQYILAPHEEYTSLDIGIDIVYEHALNCVLQNEIGCLYVFSAWM